VDRSHGLVGEQPTGPTQPPGRERRLATHRQHAAEVERLRRGPVEVSGGQEGAVRRLRQLQALRYKTEPPRRLGEAMQVLYLEGRLALRRPQRVICRVVPVRAQRCPRLLEQLLPVVGC
jgi:hypothetical protein